MTDQTTMADPASEPHDPVAAATYDAQRHAALPGVQAPFVAYAPGGHLSPAAWVPPEQGVAVVADPEPEPDPTPEAAVPVAAREPAPEPAADGQFARSYL
jgi:hypothetical protein